MKRKEFASGAALVRRAKTIHLVASALLAASGIFLIAWSNLALPAARTIAGINFILIGAAGAYGYFSNDLYRLAFQFDLAFGAFGVLFGIIMLAYPDRVSGFASLCVGVYTLLDGLMKIQTGVEGRGFGLDKWLLIVLAGAGVWLCGTAAIIFSALGIMPVLWIGIALAADGAVNFVTTMYAVFVGTRRQSDGNPLLRKGANENDKVR